MGFGVVYERKGDVLLVQTCKTGRDFIVLALRLRADGHGVAGFGQLNRGQFDLALGVAHGVAGLPVHLADGNDVTTAGFLDFRGLLTADGVHTAEFVCASGTGVAQGQIRSDRAGEHLDEGVLAELIGNGLEHERAGCAVRIDGERFAVCSGNGGHLSRVGNIVRDRLQHGFGAAAARGAAAQDGDDAAVLQADADALDGVFLREHHVFKELLHQLFVRACGRLEQGLAQSFHLIGVRGGHVHLDGLVALGLVSHVMHQIDHARAVAHRRGHCADGAAVLFLQRGENGVKVAVVFVGLGNVEHGGHVGVLQILPAALGADRDAVLRAAEDDARLNCAQRAHDLAGKVKEAGAVEHVDLAAAVVHRGDAGGNGDLALDFFRVIVTDGVAVGNLALTVDGAGHVQHAFSERGFAAAAVPEQAYVADGLGFVAHEFVPLLISKINPKCS